MTTLLNVLNVAPCNQARLLDILRENTETVVRTLDGWISTRLIASADGTRVLIHSEWRDGAAIAGMRSHPRMIAYFPKIAELASLDSTMGEVAYIATASPCSAAGAASCTPPGSCETIP